MGTQEDYANSEAGTEYSDNAFDDLELRVLSVLGNDPELTARLMPQIISLASLGFVEEGTAYTSRPPKESAEASGSQGITSSLSFVHGNGASVEASGPLKHDRERDGSQEPQDNGGIKKQRVDSDGSSMRNRRFACHFHKKDPVWCCPSRDTKFRVCISVPPNFRELRRVK